MKIMGINRLEKSNKSCLNKIISNNYGIVFKRMLLLLLIKSNCKEYFNKKSSFNKNNEKSLFMGFMAGPLGRFSREGACEREKCLAIEFSAWLYFFRS